MAAGRNLLLGNLPRVPDVGHPRAPLLQRAVGPLPARVPCLRVERVGLTPRRARRVVRVGSRRRIDEVANGGGVQNVGAAIKVDQVRQGHGRVRDDQRHVPVRAQAQHLVPRVPRRRARGAASLTRRSRCRLRRRPSCATTNRASASPSHFHWSTCAVVRATRLMSLRLSQTMKRAAARGPAGIVCTGMTQSASQPGHTTVLAGRAPERHS